MDINPESKIPLYYQLKEKLKAAILGGTYEEGDLIPSERELGEEYNLSSTTIRRALNELVYEDLLERKAGKGTFVRPRKSRKDLKKILGFTDTMLEKGLVPVTRVLEKKIVPAGAYAREVMGLKKGTKVAMLRRIRLANDLPMMLETRYIRMDLCPDIIKYDLDASIWKDYEKVYGHKPYRHSRRLKLTVVSGKDAELLQVEDGSVVFLIKGVTHLEDGRAIECEESFYRSDIHQLSFEAVAAP